jgi:trimeric autotransporter adhesin
LLNASPGEVALNGLVNGNSFASNVTFGTVSKYSSVTSGLVMLDIEPSGSTAVLLNETVSLLSNMPYTVMVAGYPPRISTAILTDNNSVPSAGNILLRFINASPSLGTADVYVVAPNKALDSMSPTVSFLTFESASNYVSLAAGNYEVVFTETGQTVPVISSGSLTFTAGQVRSIVGLDGAATGYTTVVLNDLN